MKQRRQKGSILGFVLVGALLTALIVGGVFAAKRYIAGQQAGNSTDAPVVKAPTKDTEKTDNSNKPTQSNQTDLQKALQQQADAEKKAQEQKAASESASKTASSPASSTSATSNTAATSADSLPTTGPEDSLFAMLGATLLAGAAVAYRRSRALI